MLQVGDWVKMAFDDVVDHPMEDGKKLTLFKGNKYEFKGYIDDQRAELWWDKDTGMTCKPLIAKLEKVTR